MILPVAWLRSSSALSIVVTGPQKGRVVIGVDNRFTNASEDLPGEWSVSGEGSHVVVIDHHDSFTYNLVQALARPGVQVSVRLSDQLTLEQLQDLQPDRLLLSPGPGAPAEATLAHQALEYFHRRIPVLGVCLGHQVIAEHFGARVEPTGVPAHGKPESVYHDCCGIFSALPVPFSAARYHSLAVVRDSLPDVLRVTAWSGSDMVMGLGVPGEATWGVQFHPESFLTEHGDLILEAFISGVRCREIAPESVPGQERTQSGAR